MKTREREYSSSRLEQPPVFQFPSLKKHALSESRREGLGEIFKRNEARIMWRISGTGDSQVAEKMRNMPRRAQHERIFINDFKVRSVRPERQTP